MGASQMRGNRSDDRVLAAWRVVRDRGIRRFLFQCGCPARMTTAGERPAARREAESRIKNMKKKDGAVAEPPDPGAVVYLRRVDAGQAAGAVIETARRRG